MQPFLVSLDTISPEGQTIALQFEAREIDAALTEAGLEDVSLVGGLSADVTVLPSGRDVFVIGGFSGRVRYRCVRCLSLFEAGLQEKFHLTFAHGEETGRDMELHSEDLDLDVLQGSELDLSRVVLEQLYLALRPHPVCRETCRGLCSQCGADLNESECGCTRSSVDPRFAVLAQWARGG